MGKGSLLLAQFYDLLKFTDNLLCPVVLPGIMVNNGSQRGRLRIVLRLMSRELKVATSSYYFLSFG